MPEQSPVFSVPPEQVREKIKHSNLESIQPDIVDLSWINETATILDEILIEEVFYGNAEWAHTFFRRWDEMNLQMFPDPENTTGVYIVSSRKNDLVTMLKSRKIDLLGQVEILADRLFVSDPTLQKAIDISTLLPKGDDALLFSMTGYEPPKDKNGKARSNFGYSKEQNKLDIDQIFDLATLTSCCHEIGHAWSFELGLDKKTQDHYKAKRDDYKVEKDISKRGWDAASKGISEVLFSERVANIIGKIIARKIEKTGVLSDEMTGLFSRTWRDNQEAVYDEHYLGTAQKAFPEIASKIRLYFASRLNRTRKNE